MRAAARELDRLQRLPFAAYVSDPCDGRSQGTTAMMDSLPYRNDAALVLKRLIRSLPLRRGVVGIATCDKAGSPAMMMALAGLDHAPGVIVTGGDDVAADRRRGHGEGPVGRGTVTRTARSTSTTRRSRGAGPVGQRAGDASSSGRRRRRRRLPRPWG